MTAADSKSHNSPDWNTDPTEARNFQPPVTLPTVTLIVATCVILYFAKGFFLPLALAMLFTFILSPVVNLLSRSGLRDGLSVALTVIAAAALMASFLLIVAYQIAQIGSNLPQYEDNVFTKIDTLLEAGNDSTIVSHLRVLVENISERMGTLSDTAAGGTANPDGAMAVEVVQQTSPADWLTGVILPAFKPLGVFGLIFVVVTFALLERVALRDKLVQLIGGTNVLATSRLLAEAGSGVSTYLLAQVLVNVIYAVPIWLGLWLIGIPNALFFGLFTMVARFLPYIGGLISAVLALLMAFAISPDWSLVLWTAGLFLVVELVTSNAIEPWFYGQRTGLSALAVIVSAMFWTWLWGPLGLFLATPLTVCLVVIGHHVPGLRLFSIILGDKPLLNESARLYDRLLIGRSFSFSEIVANSAKGNLPDYYNRTVVPALMLAQSDYEAGLLSDFQLSRIAHATITLMNDMESAVEDELAQEAAQTETDEDDPDAAPKTAIKPLSGEWADLGNRVVVVGARTRLDGVAAILLGQQLRVENAETLVLQTAYGITEKVRDFKPTAIVVTTLGSGTQRSLGIQLRQLRRAFPKARVVAAVWRQNDTAEETAQNGTADFITIGTAQPAQNGFADSSAAA